MDEKLQWSRIIHMSMEGRTSTSLLYAVDST